MTPSEVNAILLNVVMDNSANLKRGLKDRERIAKTMARGEEPFGHRIDWIHDTVNAMIRTLRQQARLFNETYPADRISMHDMGDAIATLHGHWVASSKNAISDAVSTEEDPDKVV